MHTMTLTKYQFKSRNLTFGIKKYTNNYSIGESCVESFRLENLSIYQIQQSKFVPINNFCLLEQSALINALVLLS